MSVESEINTYEFTGGGSDASPYAFNSELFDDDDIECQVRVIATGDEETVLTLTTDYTVAIASDNSTATVTLVSTTESDKAFASGNEFIIKRKQPLTQPQTFRDGDGFPEEAINASLDKLALGMQHLQAQVNRCIKVQDTEPLANLANLTLPTLIDNDSRAITINDTADGVTVGEAVAGQVTGPGSSTDNAVTRFSGTTGILLQNSGVIIDDSDNISGIGTIASGAHTVDGALLVKGNDITLEVGAAGKRKIIFNDTATPDQNAGQIEYAQTAKVITLGTNIAGGSVVVKVADGDTALTLASTKNATFAGDVTLTSSSMGIGLAASTTRLRVKPPTDSVDAVSIVNSAGGSECVVMGNLNGHGRIRIKDSGNNVKITLDGTAGDGTFAGDVTLNKATGDAILTIDTDNGGGTDSATLSLISGTENASLQLNQNASRLRLFSNTVGARIELNVNTNDNALTLNADTTADFASDVNIEEELRCGTGSLHGSLTIFDSLGENISYYGARPRLYIQGSTDAAIVLADTGATADQRVFSIQILDEQVTFDRQDDDGGVGVTTLMSFDLANDEIDLHVVTNYTWVMGSSTVDPSTHGAPDDWVEVDIGGTAHFLPAYLAT